MLQTNPVTSWRFLKSEKNASANAQLESTSSCHWDDTMELSGHPILLLRDSSPRWSTAHMWNRTTKQASTKIKAFDLCSEPKMWISKTRERFLYPLACTSAYFKSVVLIVFHARATRERVPPPLLAVLSSVRSGYAISTSRPYHREPT